MSGFGRWFEIKTLLNKRPSLFSQSPSQNNGHLALKPPHKIDTVGFSFRMDL